MRIFLSRTLDLGRLWAYCRAAVAARSSAVPGVECYHAAVRIALLLSALLAIRAAAAPDAAVLIRSALPPGFAPVAAFDEPVFVPMPVPVPVALQWRGSSADTTEVALPPLLERHLSTTDSFQGAAGRTMLGGTLDFKTDGYLAVTPPNAGTTYFFKIERGMSGSWHDGVRGYKVSLSVSIFRPRLANWIQIRESGTERVVWERRISDLFRLTYAAGEPVTVAGRPYRLFYSRAPDLSRRPATPSSTLGLCFIYDDTSAGGHDYKYYMVPIVQITGAAPTSYKLYGGAPVRLRAEPDLSVLRFSR